MTIRPLLAAVALVALAGCAGASEQAGPADDAATPSRQEPEPDGADANAREACRAYVNAAGGARAGALTESELHERLEAVRDSAQLSEDEEIRTASEDLLAAATTGTTAEFADAVRRMDAACAIFLPAPSP